ncbi:helix-hairpin-helix domain-containing protein [Lactobacillus sp. Sy-1]|uniref:helix-hairpin-helix domain-containing protein n=1 Tax=Lactobacillus sp. Sy-1 TaxID=2109645 RepID=UPI001C58E8C7|nr:helix-hairpin-helix domain-containing protein [Lactobacillus sp. Sy-1]MBW1605448.1 helix-hairpin-helix domain-containing protein [Lactobacillus sp. Sy-1]
MNRIKELIDTYRYYIIGGALAVMLILAGVLLFGGNHSAPNDNVNQLAESGVANSGSMSESSSVTTLTSSGSSSSPDGKMVVDIKGAVKDPGIYKVGTDTRVSDLVELAGGFTKAADHKNVNLAQRLNDQQVVYIPLKGEVKGNVHLSNSQPSQTTSSDSISNSGDDNGKININTADKEKLQTITGIGEKKAENIISYREQKGAFKSIEDIKNADGIGDKMFENMKDSITV